MKKYFDETFRKFNELITLDDSFDLLLTRTCELLKKEIPHYDWVGFYFLKENGNELELGPFAGKPTEHTQIPIGKGICGQVAVNKKTMIVQDVKLEDNYIACSLEVQSEIVVPILKNGLLIGEIDIDSHAYAPFGTEDEQFLTKIADLLSDRF
jgi:GAF domain-containing protein